MLLRDLREVFRPDWSGLHPRAALRCIPAVPAAMELGRLAGNSELGVMAAAGAVSVGFGSFQQLNGSRIAPMLLSTCGMCIASWMGTFAGRSDLATIALVSFAGFLYVAVSALGTGYSWIALQCAVWLIISTAYPASGLHALERGTCVLAGGAIQLLIIQVFWLVERSKTPLVTGTSIAGACTANGVRDAFDRRSCLFLFAMRAAITLGSSAALYRLLKVPNGYWIPMTCVIVLRGDMRQSIARGLARVAGTTLGVGVATIVVSLMRPSYSAVAGLVLLFAWVGYALLWVNYAMYATVLTAYVVFLLAFAGLPEPFVIHHRLLNTLLGGIIAFGWHVIFFPWEKQELVRQQRHVETM